MELFKKSPLYPIDVMPSVKERAYIETVLGRYNNIDPKLIVICTLKPDGSLGRIIHGEPKGRYLEGFDNLPKTKRVVPTSDIAESDEEHNFYMVTVFPETSIEYEVSLPMSLVLILIALTVSVKILSMAVCTETPDTNETESAEIMLENN